MSLSAPSLVQHVLQILSPKGHPELAAHILHKLILKLEKPSDLETFWVHFSAALSERVPAEQFAYPLLVFAYFHKKQPQTFSARDLFTLLFYFSKRRFDAFENANLEEKLVASDIDCANELLDLLYQLPDMQTLLSKPQYSKSFPIDHPCYLPTNHIKQTQEPESGFYFYFLQPKQNNPFYAFNNGWGALLEHLFIPIIRMSEHCDLVDNGWELKYNLLQKMFLHHQFKIQDHFSTEQTLQVLYWTMPASDDFKNHDRLFIEQTHQCLDILIQANVLLQKQIPSLVLQSSAQMSVVRNSSILLQALCEKFPQSLNYYNYIGASVAYYLHEHLRRLEFHKNSSNKIENLFEYLCSLGMNASDIVLKPNPMDVAHSTKIQSLIEQQLLESSIKQISVTKIDESFNPPFNDNYSEELSRTPHIHEIVPQSNNLNTLQIEPGLTSTTAHEANLLHQTPIPANIYLCSEPEIFPDFDSKQSSKINENHETTEYTSSKEEGDSDLTNNTSNNKGTASTANSLISATTSSAWSRTL